MSDSLTEELEELRQQNKELSDDYDLLGKFFIAYCGLPKGTVPDIGVTATRAYLTLMTRGSKELKPEIMKFVEFVKLLMNQEPPKKVRHDETV